MNFAGWPFAAVYGPLQAVFGTVAGWNLFVLLTYVGAGGFAALWLRALGLPLGAALVGGLAFALAPYRVAQSTGHLLGPISMLLPLALYGVERRKTWLAAAALASIPLSGQVHLALGAIPFVLAYAVARRRPRLGAIAAVAGVAGGAVVWALSLRDAAERPFSEVERYSATLGDFLTRDPGEFERFVYVGWLLPVIAIAGVGCLCFRNTISSLAPPRPRARARRGRSVPARAGREPARLRLALAEYTPARDPGAGAADADRVPLPGRPRRRSRSLVFQKHKARSRLVAVVAALVVAADLWVPLYDPLNADEGNAVYERVRGRAAGAAARAAGAAAGRLRRERLPLLRDAGAARAAARLLDLGAAGGVPRRAASCRELGARRARRPALVSLIAAARPSERSSSARCRDVELGLGAPTATSPSSGSRSRRRASSRSRSSRRPRAGRRRRRRRRRRRCGGAAARARRTSTPSR